MPVTRNLSDKSVEAYKQSLKTYLLFLEEEKSLVNENVEFEAFTRDNVKDFIAWLKNKNSAPKTINLKLTAIRSFLKFCSEEDFELRGIYTEVRLSTDSISLVLKTAAVKARKSCSNIPEHVHCHLMRKTKAMNLYKSGVPLPFIMQLLGHESMSTTLGFYAFATLEMMTDGMNKAAPSIDDEEKLWKKEEVKKLLYSLD